MADKGPGVEHGVDRREGDHFGTGEREQGGVILEHLLRVLGRQRRGMVQQIVFDLVPDNLGSHQATHPRGAEREHRFVQAPGRHNPPGQDVRIEKQPQRGPCAHARFLRGAGRSWAASWG